MVFPRASQLPSPTEKAMRELSQNQLNQIMLMQAILGRPIDPDLGGVARWTARLDLDHPDPVVRAWATVSHIERLLEAGQSSGHFRAFDPYVMGTTVQRAVDGVPFLLQMRPDLDLDHYADELVALFDRATRA